MFRKRRKKWIFFFKDLLQDTALNLSRVSMPGIEQPRNETRADRVLFREENLAELTGQWRTFAVSEQIERIKNCCDPMTGKAIAERLGILRQCLSEEEGPKMDISLDSLWAMHAFIAQIPQPTESVLSGNGSPDERGPPTRQRSYGPLLPRIKTR
jgi:hypothetical protein